MLLSVFGNRKPSTHSHNKHIKNTLGTNHKIHIVSLGLNVGLQLPSALTQLLYRREASTPPLHEQNTNELRNNQRSKFSQNTRSASTVRMHIPGALRFRRKDHVWSNDNSFAFANMWRNLLAMPAGTFCFAADLCDVEGGIAVFFENVRFSCHYDGIRAHTHASPVVNHEQTQHSRCCVSDNARHVMHNVERRCDAYGLLFFVSKSLETNKM